MADTPENAFFEILKALGYLVGASANVISYGLDEISFAGRRSIDARKDKDELARLSAHIDTSLLKDATARLIANAAFPSLEDFAPAIHERYGTYILDNSSEEPARPIRAAMMTCVLQYYALEELNALPMRRVISGEIEAAKYRDELLKLVPKVSNPAKTMEVMSRAFADFMIALVSRLPPVAQAPEIEPDEEDPTATTVALIDVLPDAGTIVNEMILPFFHPDVIELGLFTKLRAELSYNQENAGERKTAHRDPTKYEGTPRALVSAFLAGTRIAPIFETRFAFSIPLSRRLEHTAIVAGTGHGKTQLLQDIIATDLEAADPPGMVVIDSTGAMVKRIQRLAIFNARLRDRILIIDPEDDPVPALNMFDVSNPRLQTYGRAVREEVETEIIALFNYVFESLATEMTGRQSTAFSFIVRLLLSIPGATIHTLRELLEDDTDAFAPHIAKLDQTAQAFFKNHFYSKPFRATRAQIAQRLYALIQVPAFERMFSSTNRLDMYEELQRGTIILINTSTRLLKEDASPLFGRYMIARTLAAVFERAAIREEDRKPAFLIVDEAAPYFDDTFEAMLTRVRQFKLGVVIAFQHLEQTSEKLRSAIASNTSVKMAGGLGYSDSRWLSREMHTTPEFLQAQKRDPHDPPAYTHFACHVRNYTETAVSLKVPIGKLEGLPRMTDAEHEELRVRNRARVSSAPPAPATPMPDPPVPKAPAAEPAPKPPQPEGKSEAASDWQ